MSPTLPRRGPVLDCPRIIRMRPDGLRDFGLTCYNRTYKKEAHLTQINSNSSIPLYRQIAGALHKRIRQGLMEEGSQFSSEARLGEEFGVSRITVRQALAELEQKDLVERVPGKGTYVRRREPRAERITRLSGFGENMAALGITAGYRTLRAEEVIAPSEVSDRLGVPGRRLYLVERVLLADGVPVGAHISYLPMWLVNNASEAFGPDLLTNGSLYAAVEKAGASVHRAEEIVEPVLLGPSEAEKLETGDGDLALQIRRTVYDISDRPIEYVTITYRADSYTFRLELRA